MSDMEDLRQAERMHHDLLRHDAALMASSISKSVYRHDLFVAL